MSELSCMVCGFQLKAQKEWAHSTKDLLGMVEGISTDEVCFALEIGPSSGTCRGPN